MAPVAHEIKQRDTAKRDIQEEFIIRSPYSDITIPDLTVDELVWHNVRKWIDKTAVANTLSDERIFKMHHPRSCSVFKLPCQDSLRGNGKCAIRAYSFIFQECGNSGERLSYRELQIRSKNLGRNLSCIGLTGGTALLVLPNCLDYPVAVLGLLEAGVTVSGANPLYSSGELKSQIVDCGAELIVTRPELVEKVRSTGLRIPILCTGNDYPKGVYSFNQMTETNVDGETPPREERLRQIAFLPFSSGTTGLPKGVMLTHRNIVANIKQMTHPELSNIKETTGDKQDTLPAFLPFFHIYGLVLIMLRGLTLGVKLVTLPTFNSQAFMKILQTNKDVAVMVVPPIISFLANRNEVEESDLKEVKHTVTGGAPCRVEDLQRLAEKSPHTVCQGYGLTEASPGLTFPRLGCKNKATVGFLLPNTLACVLDPQTRKPLPRGSQGELCFKGPQVMRGYFRRAEATAEILDAEGWLHTGDIGYVDSNGHFFIVDRIKELIKVKGFQVAPAELEAVLCKHPSISDAGITSAPSLRDGEAPVAFITLKPGVEFDEDTILKWLEERIAPYKKPAKIIVITEIPRSPSVPEEQNQVPERVQENKV